MEGSRLSHEQTRYIYETKTVLQEGEAPLNVDDIAETIAHFRCIDLAIDMAKRRLTESTIKQFHYLLKSNSSDEAEPCFAAGEYKKLPNVIGNKETTPPEEVASMTKALLDRYNRKERHTLEDIVDFHAEFEDIHPFQDGNGRVGRLIAFKECLRDDIVPFLILDSDKQFYYRGLSEYRCEKSYLLDTCRHGQDILKEWLDCFRIAY